MSQEKTSRDILGCRNPWDLKCVDLGVLRSVIQTAVAFPQWPMKTRNRVKVRTISPRGIFRPHPNFLYPIMLLIRPKNIIPIVLIFSSSRPTFVICNQFNCCLCKQTNKYCRKMIGTKRISFLLIFFLFSRRLVNDSSTDEKFKKRYFFFSKK